MTRRSGTSGYGFSEQTVDVNTALAPAAGLAGWSKQITGDGWAPDGPPATGTAGGVATFGQTNYLASIRNIGAAEPSTAGTGR